ncbi:hypothetical protein [Streptomyces pseudovenezuelae]|uniref:Uncharacterized protein n=1 Tax=Streptomyces pseudovenezuelae TaxID=67350 RepID=A0ABZ1XBM6_9ACTN|nr:hypothetical protein [Streptomyces pseudovenezuelae]
MIADGRRARLDELLGHSFTVPTAVRPSPSPQAVTDSLGGRTVPVADLGDERLPRRRAASPPGRVRGGRKPRRCGRTTW